MLPKVNRLNRNEFKAFFADKKKINIKSFDFGTVFYLKPDVGFKIGLILGKKSLKSKVKRNLARRWLYQAIKAEITLSTNIFIVIKLLNPPTSYKQAIDYVQEIKKHIS